jgi:hypothetical protein
MINYRLIPTNSKNGGKCLFRPHARPKRQVRHVRVLAFALMALFLFSFYQGARTVNGQELPPILNDAFAKGRLSIDCLGTRAEFNSGTDEELRALCQITSLKDLDLDIENFSDAGLVDVGKLKNLRVLKIGGSKFTPAALEALVELPDFQELHYYSTRNTDVAAKTMSRLVHLKVLDISRSDFSDADIQLICTNKSLEYLQLENNPHLTDQALREIGNLEHLEKLAISGNKNLGDKSCEYLAKCLELRGLGMGATQVTDCGIEKLLKLRKLEDLGVPGTRITAKSVDLLSELPKLRHLGIFGNQNLGDEIVPLIKKYKSLDTLMCFDTGLTPKGLKELAKSRRWKTFWPSPDEHEDKRN